MFYELDRKARLDILAGGLWYNPDTGRFVEVLDMEEATGDVGVTFVEVHDESFTPEIIEEGARMGGFFIEQRPPKPPRGRKQWSPRPWTPPPTAGHLFWMPPPLEGPIIVEAWRAWEEEKREGRHFKDLPENVQNRVLLGAELAYHLGGGRWLDRVVAVIKEGSAGTDQYYTGDAIVTLKPTDAVLETLSDLGVEADG